jgi:hypothetical protein
VRTFLKTDLERAAADWEDGEFDPHDWPKWRALAAEQGIIFPPRGTRWDSWEDELPSQRAIVIRAIRNHPTLLRRSIFGSSSWGEVTAKLIVGVGELREEAGEEDYARSVQADELSPSRAEAKHALERIGSVMARMKETGEL